MALNDQGYRDFPFVGTPYVFSQLTGSYQTVPDFLDTQHPIETKEDADAYLVAPVRPWPSMLDQEVEHRHDVALGVIPPDFVIDKTLIQMRPCATPSRTSPTSCSPWRAAPRRKESPATGSTRQAAIYDRARSSPRSTARSP